MGSVLCIRAQVVPRIDHDDRTLLRGRSGHDEERDEQDG